VITALPQDSPPSFLAVPATQGLLVLMAADPKIGFPAGRKFEN